MQWTTDGKGDAATKTTVIAGKTVVEVSYEDTPSFTPAGDGATS